MNLSVSHKVLKGAWDGAILIRGYSNLEDMFRLCLNFYSDISFTSSKLRPHACFKLWRRTCTKNQICVSSLLHINRFFGCCFVLGYPGNPISPLMHSTHIKVELSLSRVLSTFLKSTTQSCRWLKVKTSCPKYIFCINIPKIVVLLLCSLGYSSWTINYAPHYWEDRAKA